MSQRGSHDRLEGVDINGTPRTFVVGGGLAGLTAGAVLARSGRPVTVLEAAAHIGGRARTRTHDGFSFNLGPHAVYKGGAGVRVLRRLGITPDGRSPSQRRAGLLVDGRIRGTLDVLVRDVHQRTRLLRFLGGLDAAEAADLAGTTARAWIDGTLDDPCARAVAGAVARTATYQADLDRLDASAAAHQLRAAARGVVYLHGGWSQLVTALADSVRRDGGGIMTGMGVVAVEHDEQVRSVRLTDGTTLPADAVVVAVQDPTRAAGLLDGPGRARLAGPAAAADPIRMAHLDVALRPSPSRRRGNVFGIDQDVFVNVPSDVAALAPPGGMVVHAARYLRAGEETGDWRPWLEDVLEVALPGWRDDVVDARYVPRSMVAGDAPRPETGGGRGRPGVDVAGVAGLAVAGDWVRADGYLYDAAVASGEAAARALLAIERPVHV